MSLEGRKILLGVSSSIAAYKSAILIRLLIKQKVEVQVIMTPASLSFITPLTLSTLSKKPVYSEFVSDNTGTWNNHVDLGLWADLMVVAPASANTIASMANGICNNLLVATYLSARCPVMVAPAMDLDMYSHASTQSNFKRLKEFGVSIIDAENGELASGLSGVGRMAEPENIVDFLKKYFSINKPLAGKKALVTAGPTYEYIDPVRFIGNASSGKMGYAIAQQLFSLGADVTIISGPVSISLENPAIKIVRINSAIELYNETTKLFNDVDIAICAAAVADYTPVEKSTQKIKKKESELTIDLVKTKDTLKTLGSLKQPNQILVGFALETNNELENASEKLKNKNCDLLVLNSMNDEGAGFNTDTNKITLLFKSNKIESFPLKSKQAVAADICNAIIELIKK